MIQQQSRHGRLFLALALAGLVAAGAQTPALADSAQGDTIAVNAQGLDLRTPEGAATLRHRVIAAAHQLCAARFVPAARSSDEFMNCVRDFTRGATPQMQALVSAARGQEHYVAVNPVR
ncbi:MAG TPA: UrcA family protein [Acetobacteraceae bacterium]|nr:UrcA family protein [Acetobacteraceae bacterium]